MARQLETAARWRNKSQLQAATAAAVNLQPTLAYSTPPLHCLPAALLVKLICLSVCLSLSVAVSISVFVCLPVAWRRLLPLSSITKIKIALHAARLALFYYQKRLTPSTKHAPPLPPAVFCCNYFLASPCSPSLLLVFPFSSLAFTLFCVFVISRVLRFGRRKIR